MAGLGVKYLGNIAAIRAHVYPEILDFERMRVLLFGDWIKIIIAPGICLFQQVLG